MFSRRRGISNSFVQIVSATILLVCPFSSRAANEPFSKVPQEQREALKKRLDTYVKLQRDHDWSGLFDLVSETGKGGVSREKFISAMKRGHGRDFANEPDLLEFLARRTESGQTSGFDIYGCTTSTREGEDYRGIAVLHAVFEHENWFFTGWTFIDLSDPSCKELDKPSWRPPTPMKWTMPMEELR